MPSKPPAPPRFPKPPSPAPHVQAAFARVAQAKLPARQPVQAEHVRQALAVAQAKLVKVPAPPSPAGVVQPLVWKLHGSDKSTREWKAYEMKGATGPARYNKPATSNRLLQEGDTFDDVAGVLTRATGVRDTAFSPSPLPRHVSLHAGSAAAAAAAAAPAPAPAPTPTPGPKKAPIRDELAQRAAAKEEARKANLRKQVTAPPTSARKAINRYFSQRRDSLLGQGTFCAAFNPSTSQYVIGKSGGPGTKIWKQSAGGVVLNDDVSAMTKAKLAALAKALSAVEKREGSREVWACAEVDAAVKAICEKNWELHQLKFCCAEWPAGGKVPREILPCSNCSQWVM